MNLKFEVAVPRNEEIWPQSNFSNIQNLGSMLWNTKTYLSTFTPNSKSLGLWNSLNINSKSTHNFSTSYGDNSRPTTTNCSWKSFELRSKSKT